MTFYSFCFALLLPTNSLLAHNFGSNCSIFELFSEMIQVIKFLSHMPLSIPQIEMWLISI